MPAFLILEKATLFPIPKYSVSVSGLQCRPPFRAASRLVGYAHLDQLQKTNRWSPIRHEQIGTSHSARCITTCPSYAMYPNRCCAHPDHVQRGPLFRHNRISTLLFQCGPDSYININHCPRRSTIFAFPSFVILN